MNSFRIGRYVTVSDLVRWAPQNKSLSLRLTRRSRFGLFAEAAAIALLYEVSRAGVKIFATCDYELKDEDLAAPFRRNIGVLNTLFGFALLDISDQILDSRGTNIREALLKALWDGVVASEGFVGDGKYSAIVCRDPDTPLPQALRDISMVGGARSFPRRGTFARLLRRAAEEMGIGPDLGVSAIENKLVTFLYESARNAHEHARTDLDLKALSGIRGILIEKIRAETIEALRSRAGIPEFLKDYISSIWAGSHGNLISITVLDTGPGIHHRMPRRSREDDWERLQRSFLPGESSKPRGVAHRGEGLSNIVKALAGFVDFHPFFYIQSAELTAYRNLSSLSSLDADLIRLDQGHSARCGTALTLIWPMSMSVQGQIPLDI